MSFELSASSTYPVRSFEVSAYDAVQIAVGPCRLTELLVEAASYEAFDSFAIMHLITRGQIMMRSTAA